MKQRLLILLFFNTIPSFSQQSITLEQCYELANVHYPIAKQTQLLETQHQLEAAIISKTSLPQINLNAQATYQSDVIEIPIPNTSIDPLHKDQYRATLSINQLIFNGGATKSSLHVKATQLQASQKQVEVSLYALKQQINQHYFSILLAQELKKLLETKAFELNAKLKEVQSAVTYGTLLAISEKVLKAELLKINQQILEVDNTKTTLIETLSSIIGLSLPTSTHFENQFIAPSLNNELQRPELELFELKKDEIEQRRSLLATENSPKIIGFATTGYGNPGLNMLDNTFQPFYTVGVKVYWNVFDWNSNKKKRESLSINKDLIETEAEVFKLTTSIALHQQQKEIEKINALITADNNIIKLRQEVLQATNSQLKNGIITASAYLTELTNLYEAENTLIKHKIQLQLAKANYNVLKGHQ
ncbi:TolC family protein [Flavobacteriaceae bacterium F08102]|nr:TolC family protein [Flavobacteriaceae bacterium F08102]